MSGKKRTCTTDVFGERFDVPLQRGTVSHLQTTAEMVMQRALAIARRAVSERNAGNTRSACDSLQRSRRLAAFARGLRSTFSR